MEKKNQEENCQHDHIPFNLTIMCSFLRQDNNYFFIKKNISISHIAIQEIGVSHYRLGLIKPP